MQRLMQFDSELHLYNLFVGAQQLENLLDREQLSYHLLFFHFHRTLYWPELLNYFLLLQRSNNMYPSNQFCHFQPSDTGFL